jgi:type I restriction enzyme S subunit
MGMDAGASRQAVTKGHIESVPLVMPPAVILDEFSRFVTPLFSRIDISNSQSRTLTALRDTLLPKLISGELRVKAAEKIVEAVA